MEQDQEKQTMQQKWLQFYPEYYEFRYPVKYLFNLYYYVQQTNGEYKPTYDPSKREMSYEIYNINSNSVTVIRHQEYMSWQDWYNQLEKTDMYSKDFKQLKLKFDIGPLYKSYLSTKKSIQLYPEERELVFDLDSDDFKTRGCGCQGSQMCQKCWRFMECACCIIQLFCKAFGFKKYFFDFSGRRGMHGWICDESARKMKQPQREKILDYYNLIEEGDSLINIMRSEQNWDVINEQNQEEQKQRIEKILDNLFKEALYDKKTKKNKKEREIILNQINRLPFFDIIWNKITESLNIQDQYFPETVEELQTYLNGKAGQWVEGLCKYILYMIYPRFDINVTKVMNHLLKLPFSVHSKSLWISLPFDHVQVVRKYNLQSLIPQQTFYLNSPGQFEFIKPGEKDIFENQHQNTQIVGIKQITDDITPEVQYFKSIVTNILGWEQDEYYNK